MVYARAHGQRIADEDAREMASCLKTGLADVPDAVVPMKGNAFGYDNTLSLLRRAADGDKVSQESAQAALEILSGPPKSEARELVDFLMSGGATLHQASWVPGQAAEHG